MHQTKPCDFSAEEIKKIKLRFRPDNDDHWLVLYEKKSKQPQAKTICVERR